MLTPYNPSHIPSRPIIQNYPHVVSVGVHTLERFTCGIWSKEANWWSKTGIWCGAKHIFIRCFGNESRSFCFFVSLLPLLRKTLAPWPKHELCSTWTFMTFCEPFHRVSRPCIVISRLLPSLSLSLVVHLFAEWLIKFNRATKGHVMSLNRSQYQRPFKATCYLYPPRWQ